MHASMPQTPKDASLARPRSQNASSTDRRRRYHRYQPPIGVGARVQMVVLVVESII
jgi:hypothetical protein